MQVGSSKGGVLVAGTCTKDSEYKTVGDNKTPLITFSLAINGRDEEGKYVECKAFGAKLAGYGKGIKKGDAVAAAGFIETREHNGKTYTSLNCQWFNFVGSGTSQNTSSGLPEYEPYDDDDGDLPF